MTCWDDAVAHHHALVLGWGGAFKHEVRTTRRDRKILGLAIGSGGARCIDDPILYFFGLGRTAWACVNLCDQGDGKR